jgi:4,5-dihydroxyphthalate decarboxylase
MTVRFTLACTSSDRTRPVIDGRIPIKGCEVTFLPGEPEDIFRRALLNKAFDICELSMSSHILTTARGDSAYIGIPVFPSRAFRHASIYVRTDRGINLPGDLKGKRIGLPEYQQTAALWIRGMLADEYGVATRDIAWAIGGLEQRGATERTKLTLPADLDVRSIGPDDTLSGLLASGELDGIVSPRPPSCFLEKSAPVDRLFTDFTAAERHYAKKTGFFPLMHCMAVRKDVAERHPWLPLEIFRTFTAAKRFAVEELNLINVLRVSTPWPSLAVAAAEEVLGKNPWSYGFAANATEIRTMIGYAARDGLITQAFDAEQLFHATLLDMTDG